MSLNSDVIVIGAGIGGLATALRLAHAGLSVRVLERHATPGGKIRTVPSSAGPVDAGPTVLTMKHVFDQLFADVGEQLSDHVTLHPLPTLARHYWRDGTCLDLMPDISQSIANITQALGDDAARDYARFAKLSERLFKAFDAPMMQAATPSMATLTAKVLSRTGLIKDMTPHMSLDRALSRHFKDPRLAQLFGRYATYVGGSPKGSPAILSLIAHAEAAGVWRVEGGFHTLPRAIEALATRRGASFLYGTDVQDVKKEGADFVVNTQYETFTANQIVFNGDPRALQTGALGADLKSAVAQKSVEPRSLSAAVLSFAARATGPSLAHHTVFFGDTPNAEFDALHEGRLPTDATLYVCAEDQGCIHPNTTEERFEIILNAPAGLTQTVQEKHACLTYILQRLRQFGLTFDPIPKADALTMPADFDQMFPASQGALYGRSPAGMTAAFKRPTARTRVPGLYLTGGGAHPGAGVPMATLSARHAVAAIMADRTSQSKLVPTDTPGGTSTGSAMTAPKPSPSSAL
ncbi:MAG: phytoene desaturase [Silicimonas sp.]|nr:phytoene desaturase [Silicimonas sp.]